MKLIFKYFKPYIATVIVVVLLTVIQVLTELSLPDFMSGIVTDGIQYGGITEKIPYAITSEDMEVLFVDEDVKNEIINNYSLIEKEKNIRVKNQEIEFKQDVYVLNEDHSKDLENIMQEPMVNAYLKSNKVEIDNSNLDDSYSSIVRIYIRDIYNNVGLNSETIQTNYILKNGVIMLAISLASIFVQIASTYLATKTAAKIASNLRGDVFRKIESFSSSEFSKFSTASLITRTGNDVMKIQQLCQMMMRMMLMSPIMGLTAVFKVAKYPKVSWLLLVAIGIILGSLIFLLIVAVPKFAVVQKLVDRINGQMRESLEGMLVIRAFNSQKQVQNKFDDTNKELTRTELFVSRMIGLAIPIMTIIMNLLTVIISWFASKQINIDAMSIGEMMAFSQYAMHVVMSFMIVSVTFVMIPRSLVSANRISEVLNTKAIILDPDNPKQLPEENGVLEFNNVSFKYPNAEEYVLKNINFKVNPGETMAFIGSTGSGKSTIIKLIPRLFDVSEGEIKYCGINIKEVCQKKLHEKIGYATQKAILFTGDIESNITFGREGTDEELNNALKISQSLDIIETKEDGIHSLVTQGGTNYSGGQKQRLSIARTLYKKENIYIFDDSFSALDYETDKKLRKQLDEMIKENKSTVLIVAQRISTIKNADKIVVLDEGQIVGVGDHKSLLKDCKVYQEIANSQLSKEELEYARS